MRLAPVSLLNRRLLPLWERLGHGLSYLKYLNLGTPRASYVMRSLLAAWLALLAAYALDLHAPYSAASSVLLIIHPVQGAVIGKGIWRALGTLTGMLAALILMGTVGQMPWLFLLGFGLWLGLCVAGMTLLRHFRAYGATLAGYTVGLAIYGAIPHPERAFDQVMGRGAAVLIGVVCLAVVSALFSASSVRSRLTIQLKQLAAASASLLGTRLQDMDDIHRPENTSAESKKQDLMTEIYGLDDLLALGKAESADLAQRAAAVRQAMVSLFAALAGGAPTGPVKGTSLATWQSLQAVWEQAWQRASQAITQASGLEGIGHATEILSSMRAHLINTLFAIPHDETQGYTTLMIAGDRLVEQLDDYLEALKSIEQLHHPRPSAARLSVPFYRDTTAAVQNGLRALLAVLLGGAFWFATGWTYGAMMLAGLAAACALLSTAPNPIWGAVELIKGTVIAVVMAFLCTFMILPHITGWPLLLLILGLFWLPAIYATTIPKHALAGVGYLVAFTTLAAPDNPMQYDLALFLNGAVAWILATIFALLGFRIMLPRNLPRDVTRLSQTIRQCALDTLKGGQIQTRTWQWRQQHRTAQLGALLKAQPAVMNQAISQALASMHLGREVLRVRTWLQQTPVDSPAHRITANALRNMGHRADQPHLAARHARRAARSLSRLPALQATQATDTQRLAIVLLDIAGLLDKHADNCTQQFGRNTHAQ